MHLDLTEQEEGILKAWQILKKADAPIPDELQLQVWGIWEAKPWIKKVGHTLIAGPITPFG